MAMCSSFCPLVPSQFRCRSISCFPISYESLVSFKCFSIQASSSTPKDDLPARIGFLGLGIMGSPMARNLIKAGCNAIVWIRTKNKCEPIISFGANYKSSLEEVFASYPETAIEVACENHGATGGMSLGKGYVDFSIVDVATSTLISNRKSKAITKIRSIVVSSSAEAFAKVRHPIVTIETVCPLASDMEASTKIVETSVGLHHLRRQPSKH